LFKAANSTTEDHQKQGSMPPAQQALHVWQGAIGKLRELQAVFDIEDETLRAKKLQSTLQNLESVPHAVAELPRLPKATWERLVRKMKVGNLVGTTSRCSSYVVLSSKQLPLHQTLMRHPEGERGLSVTH
jgi:hypothetical protein